jgi:hypothetical protein
MEQVRDLTVGCVRGLLRISRSDFNFNDSRKQNATLSSLLTGPTS